MKNLPTHDYCCGCEACAQICPKQCISMIEDNEGFLYPSVDETKCIHCQSCEKVCPVIDNRKIVPPIETFVAQNKDDEVRMSSSSGGVFSCLAEATIADKGVVFGVSFDKNWNVVHKYAETQEDIKQFRQSKYVQSRIGTAYHDAETFLKAGRKVLFSGTPCQIAGLKGFLRKEYENLTTVDVVCHGVPSPGVWQCYLQEEVERQLAMHGLPTDTDKHLTMCSFRDKRNSWSGFGCGFGLVVSDRHGKPTHVDYFESLNYNTFLRGFIADLYLRLSCYHCPCKCNTSQSDITLADAWGMRDFLPEWYDDKGATAVLIHTSKARELLGQCHLLAHKCDFNTLLPYNPAIEKSAKLTAKRQHFFAAYRSRHSVHEAVNQCLPPTRYIDKLMWSYRKRFPKKERQLRILIVGTGSLLNYGCEAIVQGTYAILRKNLPNAKIYVCSDDKTYDRRVLPADIHLITYRKRFTPYRLLRGILRRVFHIGNGSTVHMNYSIGKRFDIVLSCGGDNFCEAPDKSLYAILTDLMEIGKRAHRYHRKYVLWGASVGPFLKEENRKLVFDNLNLTHLICVREELAYQYVMADKRLQNKTYLVADPAFCMEPDLDIHFEKVQRHIYIGLNLSALAIGHAVPEEARTEFVKAFFARLDYILDVHPEYHFVCIPHVVMKDNTAQNDILFLDQYRSFTRHKERVSMLPHNIGARKTKGYIAQMDLLIAARMHCCVGGISTATPTLFLTYSNKGRGMSYYAYGHHNYETEMQEADKPAFAQLVEKMVEHRITIRQYLQERINSFTMDAMNSGLLLRSVMNTF